MSPAQSPFKSTWIGMGLENVGLELQRPDLGTYGGYSYEQLPPLPFLLCGEFSWLDNADTHMDGICVEMDEQSLKIPQLVESALKQGVQIPESFMKFVQSPELYQRVRSNTDCYLSFCTAPVQAPNAVGFLVRFLSDSQGCLYWYLYLNGKDHAVVCSPDYYDDAYPETAEEAPRPEDIVYCSGSFEEFICRFWLENEVWFSAFDNRPMLASELQYVESYRERLAHEEPAN